MTALGQLNSQSEAVRLGTIRLLEAMLVEVPFVTAGDRERVPRYKGAVIEALDAISSQGETGEAVLAREVSGGSRDCHRYRRVSTHVRQCLLCDAAPLRGLPT
jgi:hypothetical protein